MYLVDTNIWLERLLDQEKSEEVAQFLDQIPTDQIYVTDFAIHSIGVILLRSGQPDALRKFIQDVLIDSAVTMLRLQPEDMAQIITISERYNFDFDDAYQYVVAEKYSLTLISFDSDFDHTDLGRKTPAATLSEIE